MLLLGHREPETAAAVTARADIGTGAETRVDAGNGMQVVHEGKTETAGVNIVADTVGELANRPESRVMPVVETATASAVNVFARAHARGRDMAKMPALSRCYRDR